MGTTTPLLEMVVNVTEFNHFENSLRGLLMHFSRSKKYHHKYLSLQMGTYLSYQSETVTSDSSIDEIKEYLEANPSYYSSLESSTFIRGVASKNDLPVTNTLSKLLNYSDMSADEMLLSSVTEGSSNLMVVQYLLKDGKCTEKVINDVTIMAISNKLLAIANELIPHVVDKSTLITAIIDNLDDEEVSSISQYNSLSEIFTGYFDQKQPDIDNIFKSVCYKKLYECMAISVRHANSEISHTMLLNSIIGNDSKGIMMLLPYSKDHSNVITLAYVHASNDIVNKIISRHPVIYRKFNRDFALKAITSEVDNFEKYKHIVQSRALYDDLHLIQAIVHNNVKIVNYIANGLKCLSRNVIDVAVKMALSMERNEIADVLANIQ